MKKFSKTIFALLIVMITSFAFSIFGFIDYEPISAQAETSSTTITEVDVYFIAGQSNASGSSSFYRTDGSGNRVYNLSGEWLEKAKTGYYTGGGNPSNWCGYSEAGAPDGFYWWGYAMSGARTSGLNTLGDGMSGGKRLYPVVAGLTAGAWDSYIGPEIGMTEYLRPYYGGNTGKICVFIKYASGGASLLGEDSNDGQGGAHGSWCAPSYYTDYKKQGLSGTTTLFEGDSTDGSGNAIERNAYGNYYKHFVGGFPAYLSNDSTAGENGDGNVSVDTDYSDGVIYQGLQQIKEEYSSVKNINFKGMFWLQGEAECNSSDYVYHETALKCLINDFRTDLGKIEQLAEESLNVAINENSNLETSTVPFLISEVNPTFAWCKRSGEYSSNDYITTVAMAERRVASEYTNVYTMSSYMYTVLYSQAASGSTVENGSFCLDQWHYNANDMLDIGNRGAAVLYSRNSVANLTVNAFDYETGDKVQLSKIKLLGSLTYEASVVNGVATFNNLPAQEYKIIAEGTTDNYNVLCIGIDTITIEPNATLSKNVNLVTTPYTGGEKALDTWDISYDDENGIIVTSNSIHQTYLTFAKTTNSVEFKLDYQTSNASTYFPYVFFEDENGVKLALQFCVWGSALIVKYGYYSSDTSKMVYGTNNNVFSTIEGSFSADVSIYCDNNKAIYLQVNNIVDSNGNTYSDITQTFDFSSSYTPNNFISPAKTMFGYNNDIGNYTASAIQSAFSTESLQEVDVLPWSASITIAKGIEFVYDTTEDDNNDDESGDNTGSGDDVTSGDSSDDTGNEGDSGDNSGNESEGNTGSGDDVTSGDSSDDSGSNPDDAPSDNNENTDEDTNGNIGPSDSVNDNESNNGDDTLDNSSVATPSCTLSTNADCSWIILFSLVGLFVLVSKRKLFKQ